MSKSDHQREQGQFEWRLRSRGTLVLEFGVTLIAGAGAFIGAFFLPHDEPIAWFGRTWWAVIGGILVLFSLITAFADTYRARLTDDGFEVQALLATYLFEYSQIESARLKSTFFPAFYQDHLRIKLKSENAIWRSRWFFFGNIFAASSSSQIETLVNELKSRIEFPQTTP